MSLMRTQMWVLRSEFRQQSLFALLKAIPPKCRPQAEFQAAIDEFRARLETLNAAEADHFSVGMLRVAVGRPLLVFAAAETKLRPSCECTVLPWNAWQPGQLWQRWPSGWLKRLYQLYLRLK